METVAETVRRLTRLRAQFVLGSTGSAMLAGTSRGQVFEMLGWTGQHAIHTIEMGRHGGRPDLHVDIQDALRDYDPLYGAHDALDAWGEVLGLALGQALKQHNYFDNRPLFEFARHVRNAVAHGGSFAIRHMGAPAEFDGIEMTRAMNGAKLADYLTVGDILALFDAVLRDLRAMS